jgi:hypothetical protein
MSAAGLGTGGFGSGFVQRMLQGISSMLAGLVTRPDELRDLLAYLLHPVGKPR